MKGDKRDKIASGNGKVMTNFRGRLRKARKRITGCYFPLGRRSRRYSEDDCFYSIAEEPERWEM